MLTGKIKSRKGGIVSYIANWRRAINGYSVLIKNTDSNKSRELSAVAVGADYKKTGRPECSCLPVLKKE